MLATEAYRRLISNCNGRVTRPLCLSTCPQKLRKTALGGTRPLADFAGACPGFKARVVSSLAYALIGLARAHNLEFDSLVFTRSCFIFVLVFDVSPIREFALLFGSECGFSYSGALS